MLLKGASEMVLRSCNKFHNMNTGQIVSIDDSLRKTVEENIKRMADDALRTICLAYREISGSEDTTSKNELGYKKKYLKEKNFLGVFKLEETDLILVAVFGIADVIRAEVPRALE